MKEVFHPRCIHAITSFLKDHRITLLSEQLPRSEQKHTLEVKTIRSLPDTVDTTNISSTPSLEALTLPDVVVLPMSIQTALFFSSTQQIQQYQGASRNNSRHQIKVFVAYAEQDWKQYDKIYKVLMALRKGGLNIFVYGKEITNATQWILTNENDLLSADLVLLLVSLDFVSSDYCHSDQMRQAVARHLSGIWIAPIILSQCSWHLAPFACLPSILPNKGGPKPIDNWSRTSDALNNISNNIEYAIRYLQDHRI